MARRRRKEKNFLATFIRPVYELVKHCVISARNYAQISAINNEI